MPRGICRPWRYPGGHAVRLTSTEDGLLTSLTDPNGHRTTFQDHGLGRLVLDADAAGGSKALARTTTELGWFASTTTALGRTHTYDFERVTADTERQTTTAPDGRRTISKRSADQTEEEVVRPRRDSAWSKRLERSAVRHGSAHHDAPQRDDARRPVVHRRGIADGIVEQRARHLQRRVVRCDDDRQRAFVRFVVRWRLARTVTTTTPAGRQTVSTMDAQGRETRIQTGSLAPVDFTYDARGRLASVTQGHDAHLCLQRKGRAGVDYRSAHADGALRGRHGCT